MRLDLRLAIAALLLGCASDPTTREEPPRADDIAAPKPLPDPVRPAPAPVPPPRPVVPSEPDSTEGYRGWDTGETLGPRDIAYDRGDMPLLEVPRDHPRLDFLKAGSVSVGTSRDGYLVRAGALPLVGENYRVILTQASRGTNRGADELLSAVVAAADAVAKQYPGAVLQVGNIARGGGGDIPWSVSHNSGRDADLGFFVNRTDGTQFMLTDLVKLDARGVGHIAGDEVRFDAPKTWALVKSLLTNRTIELQYLFVSAPLKAMVMAVATRRKEPEALLARANEILRQPVGAAPHDDHVHVRILCPKADIAEGCLDSLKLPEGYDLPTAGRLANIGRARKRLHAELADERQSAVHLLRLLDAREAAGDIVPLVQDPDAAVRARAVRTLAAMDESSAVPAIAKQLSVETEPSVATAEVEALARFGGRAAIGALRAVVASGRVLAGTEPVPLRRLAARALRFMDGESEVVKALVAALDDPDETTRAALLETLALMTNHQPIAAPPGAVPTADDARRAWTAWLDAHGKASRTTWLTDGFKAAGVEIRRLDKRAVAALNDAVRGAEPISTNAVRALIAITRHRAQQTLGWTSADRYAYWNRWLHRHGFFGARGHSRRR